VEYSSSEFYYGIINVIYVRKDKIWRFYRLHIHTIIDLQYHIDW
jgi:hypothetical protein